MSSSIYGNEIRVLDANGNKINSLNGALNVHDADVHTVPINELFNRETGVSTQLVSSAASQSTEIAVVDATGFSVGDKIKITNGIKETTFPTIKIILGGVFTLDRPLDNSFSIGDSVAVVETDMNVSGTITFPVKYVVKPNPGTIWHIQSFIIAMTHTTTADDSMFGNIAGGLANGIILRGYSAANNQYFTLTNWKTNKDIKLDAFSLVYSDKAGGGLHGTSADGAFKQRTGAVSRLNGDDGDMIEILVQDDISSLASFEVKAQGHIETI